MRTHHISLLARDAQRNIDFYTRVLGMRLVKNSVNQENIRIRHLFYGDYLGTPGSVVTFFVVPLLGHRTDGKHFFNNIKLSVPNGSLAFWKQRLAEHSVSTTDIENGITFQDPDDVEIKFLQTSERLTDMRVVPDNGIPADYQITHLMGTELHVPDPEATAAFFQNWLGISVKDDVVELDDQQSIELFESDQPDVKTRFGRGSIDHIALQAPTKDDLFRFWDIAKEQHLNIEEYADRGWFKSLYVRDPGDNRIEIATTTPGFSLEEPILTMGQGLSLPPKFESQRAEIMAFYAKQGVDFSEGVREPTSVPD
ncbi:glyoxalase [Lentilactobacillus parabuchneri]|jgi:catechol 2,3-dioxygenase-like lactoylglutathione lyase family enzyme|uniref:Bleomycin resistance protein n=5 Tax=Lentilactobacillus parabuchneri TaxID=152331 RepID=A0A0R1YWR0_9LACO|nr:VOC family protein [Lentilactobacillus parabuchneri]APR08198.1 Putative ring-cleaving dioxygenase MhqA [Lentilactobacillus parabuchneri]KRM46714.1 bleomycin resistance protein [Lentilactobacillus parabuchneri DSM 5707 = NBRC 107865]KRN76381.1 bleomycin resistance protein [Lentilactobacillus parabuchneri]MBW0222456.1 VOC family protein [Lentilactobacillus parabuchneri]MBW0244641.1 VOC family protein [Lentilactobacillus parabuchneri]